MENQELKENIQKKLYGHTEVNVTGVSLQVENGLISLNGMVDGPEARALVEGLVRSIDGVEDVINTLEIQEPGILKKL